MRSFAVAVAVTGAVVLAAGPAAAANGRGYDVSYPQCGAVLPVDASFAVVGVNGGRAYSANPCLGIDSGESELAWAYSQDARPGFYLNTANPGPLASSYWPAGQVWPKPCAESYPENDSAECAYDYGWNAARDAFAEASAAAAQVFGEEAPDVAASEWWLDVETANTWEALDDGGSAETLVNDTAALRGARDHLLSLGVPTVGVYSTASQWQAITGGAVLPDMPVWYAGAGTESDAMQRCDPAFSLTGGAVVMSQYREGDLDADVRC